MTVAVLWTLTSDKISTCKLGSVPIRVHFLITALATIVAGCAIVCASESLFVFLSVSLRHVSLNVHAHFSLSADRKMNVGTSPTLHPVTHNHICA